MLRSRAVRGYWIAGLHVMVNGLVLTIDVEPLSILNTLWAAGGCAPPIGVDFQVHPILGLMGDSSESASLEWPMPCLRSAG